MEPDRPLGLHTDLYEIRMVESYLRLGMHEPATFSLFARPSKHRPVMIAAGLERAMNVLDRFRYGEEELAYLRAQRVPENALAWFADMEVEGELWAVDDGTPVLGNEPFLEFTGPLPIAQLLETALMNAVHFDTLIATKAARCVRAARGRRVVDFGFRRAHGLDAGLRVAAASYLGGCDATSNVEAGRRYGIPITGTMAHSFIQSFDDEVTAFREFMVDHPGQTTLLVETYDPIEGMRNAIRVAKQLGREGNPINALRIDSEPLEQLCREGRRMLDDAGLRDVKLVLSGGLDEERIDEIVRSGAPCDGFGIGSALATSSDHPALDVAYKLVEYAGKGRAKYSENKAIFPWRKQVYRSGDLEQDVMERREATAPGRPLLAPRWRNGRRLERPTLEEGRRRALGLAASIPDHWLLPPEPERPPTPIIGPELEKIAKRVRRRIAPGS
ncbi:MAG: nicotinate phosphoribosyltransferase [Myxococcota bacterium]